MCASLTYAGPRAQWTSRTLPSAAKPVPVSTRTGTTPVPSAHSTSPWYMYIHTYLCVCIRTLSAYIHIIVHMCVIVSCGLSVVGRKPPESVSRQQLAVFFDHLTGMQQVFMCGLCALHWIRRVLTDVIIQIACDFIILNLPPLAHVTKTCEDDTKSLISLTKVHAVCVCVCVGGAFRCVRACACT